jgi:hypothetical protein
MSALALSGCNHAPEAAADRGVVASSRVRPIDVDPAFAERVGHAYLDKIGYDRIMGLALQKQWIAHRPANAGNALAQGAEAMGFVGVFTRYAVAAGVASQVDSPAPGPGDVAAVGILVIGLVDAALLSGAILASITKAEPITGPTAAPPVPGGVTMATAAPTVTAPPISTTLSPAEDKEKKKRCDEEEQEAFKTCRDLLASPNPPRGLTGGYLDMKKCMKGFISEECGGNEVKNGAKGRPGRKK